jgi:hypothetical protein
MPRSWRVANTLHLLWSGERAPHQSVPDVVADIEVGKEVVVLVDEPDAPPFGRHAGHVLAVQVYPAPERRDVAGDRLEQRGLAGARRPEQRDELPARNIETDRIERSK